MIKILLFLAFSFPVFAGKDVYLLLNQRQRVINLNYYPVLPQFIPKGYTQYRVKPGFSIPKIVLGQTIAILDAEGELKGLSTGTMQDGYYLMKKGSCERVFKE